MTSGEKKEEENTEEHTKENKGKTKDACEIEDKRVK
jgi:hypothetical protein